MPNDLIVGEIEESEAPVLPRCPEPPRPQAGSNEIEDALRVLREAQRPLVIVGKGAAYARAEDEIRAFIDATKLPFLPTPMGKGVVSDEHELSIAPGRSFALQNADAILLLGARLNWILHFGKTPRFDPDVKILQLDISAEEIGTNLTPEVALVGDAKAIVGQLNTALESSPWSYPAETEWRTGLAQAVEKNRDQVLAMEKDDEVPMGYYRVLAEIRDQAPRDALIVNEGSNTMDIGRSVLRNYEPRERLDAGTFGTMGVGLGFALAAAVTHPGRRVICVEGDSAFGFSGMEVETACRYNLPITFVIVNNNGIGFGVDEIDPDNVPPFAYTVQARYEQMIEAFGGKGWFVTTPDDLAPVLEQAYALDGPSIVNIMINPRAQRKPQKFNWLTR